MPFGCYAVEPFCCCTVGLLWCLCGWVVMLFGFKLGSFIVGLFTVWFLYCLGCDALVLLCCVVGLLCCRVFGLLVCCAVRLLGSCPVALFCC